MYYQGYQGYGNCYGYQPTCCNNRSGKGGYGYALILVLFILLIIIGAAKF